MTDLKFGTAVHRLRVARGLSEAALAERAGISLAQLAKLERGQATARASREERLIAALNFPHRRDLIAAGREEAAS